MFSHKPVTLKGSESLCHGIDTFSAFHMPRIRMGRGTLDTKLDEHQKQNENILVQESRVMSRWLGARTAHIVALLLLLLTAASGWKSEDFKVRPSWIRASQLSVSKSLEPTP